MTLSEGTGPGAHGAAGVAVESGAGRQGEAFSWRFVTPLLVSSTLNPVNSSLIATALVPIAHALGVSVGRTASLVSALCADIFSKMAAAVRHSPTGKCSDHSWRRRGLARNSSLPRSRSPLLCAITPSTSQRCCARQRRRPHRSGSWRGQTGKADGADVPNRRLNPAALTGIYGAEELAAPPDLLWSLGGLTPIGRRVVLSSTRGRRSSGRSTRNCSVTPARGCKRWAPSRRDGAPSGSTRPPRWPGHKPGFGRLHRRGVRWVRTL